MLLQVIDQIQNYNEEHIRQSLSVESQELSDAQRRHLEAFQKFCAIHGLRPFPAAPAVVAAFLRTLSAEECIPAAEAIAAQHDVVGLANPVATAAVRAVLESRVSIEYPKSWSKEDRRVFASVDPVVRSIILRRENERDRALRNKQNETALQKKEIEK